MSKHEEEEFSIEDIFKDFPDDKEKMVAAKNLLAGINDEMFKEDNVNKPFHYNVGGVECIDAIMAATNQHKEGYLQGNVMKYVWRYNYKGGLEDLQKAEWYLKKLIEVYKEKHK